MANPALDLSTLPPGVREAVAKLQAENEKLSAAQVAGRPVGEFSVKLNKADGICVYCAPGCVNIPSVSAWESLKAHVAQIDAFIAATPKAKRR